MKKSKRVIHHARSDAPILIWSVGKVGSSGVRRALKRAGGNVEHFHYLHPENVEAVRAPLIASGKDLPASVLCQTAQLQAALPFWVEGGDLKVIAGVREPISRTISAFFQNYELLNNKEAKAESQILKAFAEPGRYDVCLNWFDNELKNVLGFDVYNHSFDRQRLIKTYRINNVDFLVYRIDVSDSDLEAAISKFTKINVNIVPSNKASDKSYAEAYRYVRENIVFEKDLLDRIFSSKYCRHFWTLSELAEIKSRWKIA